VCIEPWYGRADAEDFAGNLADREYGNKLAAGAEFVAEYAIKFEI
jgi:galactose mutarotase-like enzyme